MKKYTINECLKPSSKDYLNDLQFIQSLINERRQPLKNPYSPLSERLNALKNKVTNAIQAGRTEL
jgi:hypothetical protein